MNSKNWKNELDLTVKTVDDKLKTVYNLIKDNKIFTAVFTKKNGDKRIMNARIGVKSKLRGGKLAFDPKSKGLITVYDMHKQDYRMLNIETLTELRVGGTVIKFKDLSV